MQTPDITDKNIKQIAKLFPNVMTEIKDEAGNSKKAIDFDLLKQSLSDVLVDDENERYRLDWPGKKSSLLKANTPISKTLRPVRDESVNFDTTENIYIEGDNFEVLKILQESYLSKIKMIYIDPPYNTGKDFIYRDNFRVSKGEYEEEIGAVDEDGDKLFKNTDSNGRFHSDWLSMMYERLVVARDLLRDDGVIFISIDDNEVHNLRKICDEVFGEENFVSITSVQSNPRGRQSDTFVATVHDSLVIYGKNINETAINGMPLTDKQKSEFNLTDSRSKEHYRLLGLRQRGSASKRSERPDMYFPIYVCPETQTISIKKLNGWAEVYPRKSDGTDGRWMWGKDKCTKDISLLVGRIIERRKEYDVFVKDFLNKSGTERTRKYKSIWDSKNYNNQVGTQEVKSLFNADVMSFPKSKNLLCDICRMGLLSDSIILDFFSGSATTAHAVIQLNAEDNGNRKFIMVQLPEKTDEKSEAFKAGYKTIAEIGKERIRRAGKQIMNDKLSIINEKQKKNRNELFSQPETEDNSHLTIHNSQLDIGFRVYKTDTTNMKDVYYHPEKLGQMEILDYISNIKEDRTPDDLLTQVILDLGLELNLPIEQKEILGNTVFIVQTNALVACFDDNINFKIVDEIADLKPFKVVFKDTSFKDDKDRINVEERFKRLSPETVITIL